MNKFIHKIKKKIQEQDYGNYLINDFFHNHIIIFECFQSQNVSIILQSRPEHITKPTRTNVFYIFKLIIIIVFYMFFFDCFLKSNNPFIFFIICLLHIFFLSLLTRNLFLVEREKAW